MRCKLISLLALKSVLIYYDYGFWQQHCCKSLPVYTRGKYNNVIWVIIMQQMLHSCVTMSTISVLH